MEYLIIIILQAIGVGLHVAQKLREIAKRSLTDTKRDEINTFFQEDWITLFISFLVLCLNLVGHYIIDRYTDLPATIAYYDLYAFGIALVLGYAGQRLIYKYLGQAEEVLTKKVNDKLQ